MFFLDHSLREWKGGKKGKTKRKANDNASCGSKRGGKRKGELDCLMARQRGG